MTDTVSSIRTHPRIRERRVAVRRDEGRRRLRVLLVALGLVALGASAYGVTRSPVLDVDVVRVQGATNTAPEDVSKAAGLDRHPPLADVDPEMIAARVEQLPWVAQASVVRHWPRTVEVSLLERSPLAAMPAASGGWVMVDATGRVLTLIGEPPPGMVTLATPTPAPDPGERVEARIRGGLVLLEALPGSLQGRIRAVTVAEDGTMDLALDKGPPVRFGSANQLRPKLVALATLVARTNLRGVTGIDVRVPTAPVLTRG